jgi:hypothetical protein
MGSPKAQTVREAIYWQYAWLISKSATGELNRAFQMERFQKLVSDEIRWSDITREEERWCRDIASQKGQFCVYCGKGEKEVSLSWDHMIPVSLGGPGGHHSLHPWNRVQACQSCNSSKGARGLYEWFGYQGRHDINRIAEGKCLKLLFELHKEYGTLDYTKAEVKEKLCNSCHTRGKCPSSAPSKAIEMLCVEGIITGRTALPQDAQVVSDTRV